jgi:acetyl-CoA decarbonylase/synthase complex subunit gamma
MEQLNILGWIETAAGRIPRVGTELRAVDRWGAFKARWGINRMDYRVSPGLYAVGEPDSQSHVFVTANYKLTFDTLRQKLGGLDGWVMVLDTKGINVWCAAGKGTFGTDEVVGRIESTGLPEIVEHRRLIIPQLGATGVAAHEVRRRSGFSVVYGPVRAADIKPYLEAGMKASTRMRRVTFPLMDRLVLAPQETVQGLKYLGPAVAAFLALAGLTREGYSTGALRDAGPTAVGNLVLAYLAGTFLNPLLLPWLPGRAFAFRGFVLGLVMLAVSYLAGWIGPGRLDTLAWILMVPAIVSFIAMNFTGSSTFTSLSGVRKEMRVAVPIQITAAAAGLGLWIIARFH